MRSRRFFPILCAVLVSSLFFVVPQAVHGVTYYVDPSQGSDSEHRDEPGPGLAAHAGGVPERQLGLHRRLRLVSTSTRATSIRVRWDHHHEQAPRHVRLVQERHLRVPRHHHARQHVGDRDRHHRRRLPDARHLRPMVFVWNARLHPDRRRHAGGLSSSRTARPGASRRRARARATRMEKASRGQEHKALQQRGIQRERPEERLLPLSEHRDRRQPPERRPTPAAS